MKALSNNKRATKGSALVAVVLVIAVMSYLAAASLSYSVTSYRASMRQALLDKAKLSAEAEMEFLYFQWITSIKESVPLQDIDNNLSGKGFIVDFSTIPNTDLANTAFGGADWTISRTLRSNGPTKVGTTKVSGVSRPAQVNYYTALTRASQTHPLLGEIHYQLGRRFALSRSALFQFSVFYQDVMEFSTGSPMTIKGDISSNGSLYIGAQSGVNLTVVDKIFYANSFNGMTDLNKAIDPATAIYFRHNSGVANTLSNPNFSSDDDEMVARKNQIKKLQEPENFLGGTDADLSFQVYGPSGTNAYSSTNDVYRSIISPSPKTPAGVSIVEDPVIKANRMSEKAGITIEVRKTTDILYLLYPVKIYTKANPSIDYAITNPALAASIITSARKEVFDTRENKNVNITTIDIGNLKARLAAPSTPAALKAAYNGIIYAYDPNPQTTTINGIRLSNASELPYTTVDGKPVGFTVASDNGVYIQGNYNTSNPQGTANTEDNAGNPAAIMADAITLLSANWNDDNATADVSDVRLAGNPPDGEGNASATTAVYAALVSGNTPTNTAAGINSGGVQNLVRLMENWSGQNVKLVGSLGQLFESKYFTGAIRSTGSGAGRNLYLVPSGRELTFDSKLASSPPAGAPNTTKFSRGDYFIWQLSDNPMSL
ncbi:hypothetical protein [Rariglobus hedericola]|uniref:Uncharacterized protein n=1 Tax=Rariglobus hedericola TaxID=2597822 RepID=A0A556QNG9_9BACT|nr:hypothetical protein [Rariglobus hedericola]TSJ78185.1 hypothetical protein FPL22_02435 [Rariglobus hedericola]